MAEEVATFEIPAGYPPDSVETSSITGESLPPAPTACGATPSSGDTPQRPVEPIRLVERLNPPARPLLRRWPTTAPSNSLRRIPEDRDRAEIPPRPSGRANCLRDRLVAGPEPHGLPPPIGDPQGGGGASEATMGSPQQSAVLATAPGAAWPRSCRSIRLRSHGMNSLPSPRILWRNLAHPLRRHPPDGNRPLPRSRLSHARTRHVQ
jgi:hypothetical protein